MPKTKAKSDELLQAEARCISWVEKCKSDQECSWDQVSAMLDDVKALIRAKAKENGEELLDDDN